jgi:heme exporter protein A
MTHACGSFPVPRRSAMLTVDELAFDHAGQRLFSDVAFEVDQGQVLKIHGPNGGSKTLLLRVLAGALRPSAGIVRWHGEDAHRHPQAWRRSIAYLGPPNGMGEHLAGVENLRFAAAFAPVHERRAQEAGAPRTVEPDTYRRAIARGVSDGQERRLVISRLLIAHKPLWLLDEPDAASDDDSSELLERCIAGHVERGGIVPMTSHRPINTAPAATRNLYVEPGGRCSD